MLIKERVLEFFQKRKVKALVTRKIGMTTVLDEKGSTIAITLLSASPNVVTQTKTVEIDGYDAVQVGFEKSKKNGKGAIGHFKASGIMPKVVREFRNADANEEIKVGDKLSADLFDLGELVNVTANSKGKGFAGTIKRHNFHRGRKTHGGRSYRRPGSIGSMYPQRIFPGKKMAGRMGNVQVTTRNLKVAFIDVEKGLLGVAGAVPGPKKSIVLVKGAK